MTFQPVFIAGCDRSGTTMLGDILGRADTAFATPESQWIHEFLMLLHLRAFASAASACQWLRGHFRFAVWEMTDDDDGIAGLIDLDDPRATIENLIAAYLRHHGRDNASARVWIDHTPDNFKHYGVLRHYFPEARYIHIVRDGRAVYHSIKGLTWGPNNAFAATRYWAQRLQQALAVELAEGDNCPRIRYEDIVTDPTMHIAELCHHLGLRFDTAILQGGGVILPGFTRSQHQLVGTVPDNSRINYWRTKISTRDIGEFEAYTWSRTLLTKLGYELITTRATPISMPRILFRYAEDMGLYFINRLRHRHTEAAAIGQPRKHLKARCESSEADSIGDRSNRPYLEAQ